MSGCMLKSSDVEKIQEVFTDGFLTIQTMDAGHGAGSIAMQYVRGLIWELEKGVLNDVLDADIQPEEIVGEWRQRWKDER